MKNKLTKMTGNGRGDLLQHKSNGVYVPTTTEFKKSKWGFLLTITGLATTIGTAIPVGYIVGVTNSPATFIQGWCNQTLIERYDLHLTDSQLLTLWSGIISIFLIGGCIGSLVGATLADRLGRKGTLLVCGILFGIGSVLFYFCRTVSSVEVLILGRLIVGLASGLSTSVLAMYLAEIAPLELRGTLAVFSSMGVTGGVVVGQVASLEQLFGTEELWHYALSAYLLLVLICFIPYPWFPESPKYLFIVAGKREMARKELMRLRGTNEIDCINAELQTMEQEAETQPETRSIWSVLCDKTLLMPIILVCALQGGQQLSGVNAVFFYSVTIFETAGLSATMSKWANLATGCVNLVTALFSPMLMERCNRRPVILISCLISGIFLVILTFVIEYVDAVSWFPIACVFAIFGYIIAFQVGLGPIPYFIGSELFEVAPRSAAMSLGSLAQWACNFCVAMTFLSIQTALGAFVFLPFAVVCFGLMMLLYRYLPESRGRQTSDIVPLISRGFQSRRS